jgi:tetratricopeptide (TPR) repeat protein
MDNPLPELDSLWDFNDPAKTEQTFRGILPRAEAAGGAYFVELLSQIARTQGLQSRFEEAHRTLDRAQAVVDGARPAVRCLLERGRVFNSSNDRDRARPLFRRAYDDALAAEEYNLATDAAHMLAIVEAENPELSLEWNLKALTLAEQHASASRWLASLYNNIGWTYYESQRYAEALEVFHKALALRRQRNQPRESAIAEYAVAKTLRSMGRVEEALAMQRRLLAESQWPEDDRYTHEEIAECLILLGREDEARQHLEVTWREFKR